MLSEFCQIFNELIVLELLEGKQWEEIFKQKLKIVKRKRIFIMQLKNEGCIVHFFLGRTLKRYRKQTTTKN